MSTTPRTDAARGFYDMDTAVSAEDMAQLETEFTEVKANFKEERTFLIAAIKELNAEVERLKKDTSDMGTWVGSKMLQPEWDSFKQSLEVIEYWKTRAEKAEAELKEMQSSALTWARFSGEKASCADLAEQRLEKAESELARLRAENEDLAIRAGLRLSVLDYEKLNASAFKARAEKAETELVHLRAEVEGLKSRLYKGCDDERDMAISEGPQHGVCGLAEELTARAKKAEAELTRLRAENIKLWNEKKWCERDVIKAEADTARLDWLDENMGYSGGGSGGTYTFFTPADVECGMLRDAIDAAIKESIEVPDPVSIEARNPTGGD